MDFNSNKPIYLQIVDYCFRKILNEEWKEEERILSVRELGAFLQVNPNTVVRSYEYMQMEAIIYLRRGMGYYVCPGAKEQVLAIQRKEFFEQTLPATFESMRALNISPGELMEWYKKSNK
ncbi:MAG: GntR family transcriptional regulator [Tannerellaceae bacterium]|nr:GntR family transcriptional regulator [Tannerellaceae bacterium]MCD8041656.1 GntR family transcriptional regulator [Tannerellaceae bacterium]MCD8178759.1 GntR family transcriptional regulator [Tannerellaceae bacterium]